MMIKLITLLAALAVAMAAAAPEEFKAVKRDVDCGHCHYKYNFCARNGHTPGQTGCLTTCREHVCSVNPGCKTCGDPFDKCPERPRWHN